MLEITEIRKHNVLEKIAVTKHARNRLIERNITMDDIVNAVSTGEIIKQYEDDKPLPSCLILGYSEKNKKMHVVVSIDEEYMYLITAYYPDPLQWNADFKTRKER